MPFILYFNNFEGVFSAIENGLCQYGVVPIENSTAGSVKKIYDLMIHHNFSIVRSVRLKIDHNLLAKRGTKLSDVKEIYSHEQAISQCTEFLKSLGPDVKVTAVENTAAAAKMVAESDRTDVAALCSRSCMELYNLSCLKYSVQDQGNNYTRFICISRNLEIYPAPTALPSCWPPPTAPAPSTASWPVLRPGHQHHQAGIPPHPRPGL